MIVFCEECGTRNETAPEDFDNDKTPARCTACNDILNKIIARKIRIQLEKAESPRKKSPSDESAAAPPKPKSGILEPVAKLPENPELIDQLDASDLDRNMDLGDF